jgi:NTE family protein
VLNHTDSWFRNGYRALALFLLLLLGACSSVRPWQNQPLNATAARKPAMPMATTADERSMLMFVSLSGGGARAAAFGYGVLDALRQTRVQWQGRAISLLDELDVISGVSGGSITATYYAAFGAQTFPGFEQGFLRQNFQDGLISHAFRPGNLYDLSSPWFGRSNLLERRLDGLFQGKTFGDLTEQAGRPRLLVSATDLSLGASFEFTWRQFSLICSDLDSVPLSFAVAASSAVPIALSPLTLKNHNADCPLAVDLKAPLSDDFRARMLRQYQRSYLDAAARPFIHLVDGGLADNLGLRGLLDRSQADGGLRGSVRSAGAGKISHLVIIAVNAEREPGVVIDSSDQVPSIAQVLDTLLFGAGSRATAETLGLLSDTVQAWRRELSRDAPDGKDPFAPEAQIHLVNVNLRDVPELAQRRTLLQIPTAFSIAPGEVDQLVAAGRKVLWQSGQFQSLLRSLSEK